MNSPRPVVLAPRCLDAFVKEASDRYRSSTWTAPPRCWGILVGLCTDEAFVVTSVCPARNVRHSDDDARHEFNVTFTSQFGPVYARPDRGFWCHPLDILKITRQAATHGEDVLGSIHLHPDWHRIGPVAERTMIVSEKPTPVDEHLFRCTGWPVNVILYLERRQGTLHSILGAWSPPAPEESRGCTRLEMLLAHAWPGRKEDEGMARAA